MLKKLQRDFFILGSSINDVKYLSEGGRGLTKMDIHKGDFQNVTGIINRGRGLKKFKIWLKSFMDGPIPNVKSSARPTKRSIFIF